MIKIAFNRFFLMYTSMIYTFVWHLFVWKLKNKKMSKRKIYFKIQNVTDPDAFYVIPKTTYRQTYRNVLNGNQKNPSERWWHYQIYLEKKIGKILDAKLLWNPRWGSILKPISFSIQTRCWGIQCWPRNQQKNHKDQIQ